MAVLAVLKAGAAYLPIDPDAPAARTAAVLKDADPVAVLDADTTATLLTAGPGADPGAETNTAPDTGAEASTGADTGTGPRADADVDPGDVDPGDADRTAALRPDHPAYVIFTSGSTGEPKGVVVSHRNVTRLLATTAGEFGFGEDDVWTMFHSYAFDFSVWELWGALLHGGRLVVVPGRWPVPRGVPGPARRAASDRAQPDTLGVLPAHPGRRPAAAAAPAAPCDLRR
ncbi:AMP-binding protein [Streptomyces sp. M19]